jgi:acyl carrier protein
VRQFLGRTLPDHMVPAFVTDVDALPMTPNGKVDRPALPDPFGEEAVPRKEYVAPRTALEKAIAGVWQGLLGAERVGIQDNFFELGGHSLLAVRAVFAIEKRTGVRLDPRGMFFQTLEQIADSAFHAFPSVARRT